MSKLRKRVLSVSVVAVAATVLWLSARGSTDVAHSASLDAERPGRQAALARAQVFQRGAFNPASIDFSADPNAGVIDPRITTCTFVPTEPSGTTPKFECVLESGEKIKVKYGPSLEIPAEIAATRLLRGLGFPADRMSFVETVRCYGCVASPFRFQQAVKMFRLGKVFDSHLDYDRAMEFSNVAVERKLPGEAIETASAEGWAFYELSTIDPARGGASRAEVDALRLMAMFLAHWDNKPSNQRLLCAEGDTGCATPLAMLQDTGADFGPHRVDLEGWMHRPVWADLRSCRVSMKGLPFNGSTFSDETISEEGRQLLASRMTALTRTQIETLFTSAGFPNVSAWADVFQDKVRQIATAACPTSAAASSS